jgi:hypothetical protein
MSEDGLRIYVKNKKQENDFRKNHPDAKPEFIPMAPGDNSLDEILPMVCVTKDGKERCESDEAKIATLLDEMK